MKVTTLDLVRETRIKHTYTSAFYQITVKDATNKVPRSIIEDWFIAFQNGFLENSLDEYVLRHKRVKFQIQDNGNTAVVIITKRPLFWRRE